MSVSIAIAADPRRSGMARDLAAQVGGHLVWDAERSEWATHAQAWRWCAAQGTSWGVVLQDDAVPVDGFADHIEGVLESSPVRTAVGLYIGTSRPKRVQSLFRDLMDKADSRQEQWIRGSDLFWGVGVAIPNERILPAITWPSLIRPYDERLGAYFRSSASLPVLYTWPSMVDHRDEPTLLTHSYGNPDTEARRAWRVGIPRGANVSKD